MKIIKRSGSEVTFDISKIMDAVSKANMEVDVYKRQLLKISGKSMRRAATVRERVYRL